MKRLITTLLCLALLAATVFSLSSCSALDALPEGIREVIIKFFGIEIEEPDIPDAPDEPADDPTDGPAAPDEPDEPENKSYSVTISMKDGTDDSVISVGEGDLVPMPKTPVRKGYTFLGWYCGDSLWNFATDKITAETVIYAKWRLNVYNISYMLDGGSNASLNPGTFDAESGEVTLGVPTKPGYLFCGWYSDPEYKSEVEVINIDIAGDITLYAKWEINVFNITYNLGGDNVTHTNPDKYDINTGDITLGAPSRDGYTFLGWYTDPDFNTPISVINVNILGSVTIYAKWQMNIYNITYELYGGVNADVNPGTFNAETGTVTLGSASRPGYSFSGWYADPEFKTPVTEINVFGDIKVYAKWSVKVYNITYNLNGGVNSPDNPTDFNITTGIITLGIPTRDDYIFLGWFTSSDFSDSSRITVIDTNILDDITVYAGWLNISDMFEYTVYNTSLTITGYSGNLEELAIPERINGYTVTTIAEYAFANNATIKALTIPATVTTVKAHAFEGCVALEELTVYSKSIGEAAFSGCTALKALNVNSETIDQSAFAGCVSLNELTIGAGVKTVGNNAFGGATALTAIYFNALNLNHRSANNMIFASAGQAADGIRVIVGADVNWIPAYLFLPSDDTALTPKVVSLEFDENSQCQVIGSYAFSGCSSLKTVTIPRSVHQMNNAFTRCTSLETVYLYSATLDNDVYQSPVFSESGNENKGITFIIGSDVSVIPGYFTYNRSNHLGAYIDSIIFDNATSLTTIGAYAFYKARITSLELPENVTTVNEYAFYQCERLESIVLNNNLNAIYSLAFAGCSALKRLEINGYLTTVKTNAFNDLIALEELYFNARSFPDGSGSGAFFSEMGSASRALSITIGKDVTRVPNYFVRNCGSNVCSLVFEENGNCQSIGEWAFGNVNILTLEIPDSVTQLGNYAFAEAYNLAKITIGSGIGSIPNYTFRSCRKVIEIYNRSSSVSVVAGKYPFYDLSRTLLNVYTPTAGESRIRIVGDFMFYEADDAVYLVGYMANDETITLPSDYNGGDYYMHGYAIYGYKSAKTLIIPDSIIDLSTFAFSGLTKLEQIYFNATKIPLESANRSYMFNNVGVDGDGATLIISKNITVVPKALISGRETTSPVTALPNIKTVIFEDGSLCTEISDNAFSSSKLENITLPESITTISGSAFTSATAIKGTVWGGILYIGKASNPYFYALKLADNSCTSVVIHKDTKLVSDSLFTNCTALESVKLEASSLWDMAASRSTWSAAGTAGSGITLTIGKTVERIPANFISLSYSATLPKITSIEFEEGGICSEIGNYAFTKLSYIDSIVIPDSVITIGTSAFSTSSAHTIIIGNGVKTIGNSAFESNSKAHTVIIGDAVEVIGDYAFYSCSSLLHVTLGRSVTEIGTEAFKTLNTLGYNGTKKNKIYEIFNKSALTLEAGSTAYGYLAQSVINLTSSDNTDSILDITDDGFIFFTSDGVGMLIAYVGNETDLTLPSEYNGKSYVVAEVAMIANLQITRLVIPSGVESIGDYAFFYMSKLTELVIGEDVTTLGKMCFAEATKLKSITYLAKNIADINTENPFVRAGSATYTPDMILTVGKDVVRIPARIFYGTSSNLVYIKSIVFEDGCAIKSIGARAFYGVTSLSEIVLPEGLETIEEYAFYSNTGLKKVVIPGSVTHIGQYAFAYCNALQSVEILDGADGRVIENLAFYYNKVLNTVVIGSGVTSIGTEAFASADKLSTVILADSVASLGKNVFVSKTTLTIYFEGSSDEFNAIAKDSADTALSKATICFYSESDPSTEGNFWYYDEGGNVVIW